MVKRVDVAVFNAFNDAKNGTWKPGIQVLGLAEEGVGWVIDEHNRSLISSSLETTIEAARMDIISGKISVTDYMMQN